MLIMFSGFQTRFSRNMVFFLGILSFVCCLYSAIGMCGGYDGKRRPMAWINGIIIGIALFVVEASIVLFVGCVAAFKGM